MNEADSVANNPIVTLKLRFLTLNLDATQNQSFEK